jgi:hypothetical protein
MSNNNNGQDPYRSAVVAMPSSAQLGGQQPLPFVRFPFYPTSPWYSTNPNVGYQVRFYSTGILSTDNDYAVNSEMLRTVQFDLPVRVVAINGAAFGPNISEINMNLQYLFRVEYTMGDKLHTEARLASTVLGTSQNPGELGGHGYNVDQGATLICGITPLVEFDELTRVDITFVCLEMRAPRNYNIR